MVAGSSVEVVAASSGSMKVGAWKIIKELWKMAADIPVVVAGRRVLHGSDWCHRHDHCSDWWCHFSNVLGSSLDTQGLETLALRSVKLTNRESHQFINSDTHTNVV